MDHREREPARPGDSENGVEIDRAVPEAGLWTIPNLLAFIRFLGSFVLVALALRRDTNTFFWWMLVLLATDWIDGKLAILLRQRSAFGARLDTVADVTMYTALVIGLAILQRTALKSEWPWMAAAGFSYFVAAGFAWAKFGQPPSYHTRSAKTAWLLVTLAVIGLFGWSWLWPLRIATLGILIANLESIAISRVLEQPATDVISLRAAQRLRANNKGTR